MLVGHPGRMALEDTYKKYWEVVKQDVFEATSHFFRKGQLIPNTNSSVIALIPKFPNANRIEHYCLIALANFQFKIIKILTFRLASIVPKIISSPQRGFIQGRNILDCIIVTFEEINLLERKCFGGNVAIKIDIKKAFDTIN